MTEQVEEIKFEHFNRKRFMKLFKDRTKKSLLLSRLKITDKDKIGSSNMKSLTSTLNQCLQQPITFQSQAIHIILYEVSDYLEFLLQFNKAAMSIKDNTVLESSQDLYLKMQCDLNKVFSDIFADPVGTTKTWLKKQQSKKVSD